VKVLRRYRDSGSAGARRAS